MASYNEELTKDFFTELSPDDAVCDTQFILLDPLLIEPVSLLTH